MRAAAALDVAAFSRFLEERTSLSLQALGVVLVPAALPRATEAEEQRMEEELIRRVEAASVELQRQCPEDWNQFLGLVVRCCTAPGLPRKVRVRTFKI